MPEDTLSVELIRAITDLDEAGALTLVKTRLSAGHNPFEIVQACQAGLRQVGELYEQRQYYLSGLIMAGEIFREVLELLRPALEQRATEPLVGRIILGTVHGDIHDIGKNMLGMLLTSHGFAVIDLGVDVPAVEFVRQTVALKPDVVCLSSLITSAHASMRETVTLLRAELAHSDMHVPIMIGGGLIDEHVFRYVGADYWAVDAMDGVRLCRQLAGARPAA